MCIQLRPESRVALFQPRHALLQQSGCEQHDDLTTVGTQRKERTPTSAAAGCAGLEPGAAGRLLGMLTAGRTSAAFARLKYTKLVRFGSVTDRAQKIDDKNPLLYLNRGSAYLAAQDFKNAQADFAVLTTLTPDDHSAQRLFGFASLRLYDFANAHKGWAALGKLIPTSPEPLHNAAITYKAELQVRRGDQGLSDAIQFVPRSDFVPVPGQVFHMVGKFKEAEDDLKFVLNTLKQRKGEILNDYGDLWSSGRPDEPSRLTKTRPSCFPSRRTLCRNGTRPPDERETPRGEAALDG